ncbi:MAG: Gldg family protein [Flavobacteriales bacterium]|nr:Gldg family protein [Flavobacteriales bacterium]
MKRKSPKYRHLIELLVIFGVIFVINIIAGFKFYRIDLTEDKIHSLNPKTIEFLGQEAENVMDIVIYLQGDDLPPSVQKFRQALKDKLDEFQAYAGNKIKYKFIDIAGDPALRDKYLEGFAYAGVNGNRITNYEQGGASFVDFYPIVELRYNSNTVYIDFMPDMLSVSPYYVENKIKYIEYELLKGLYSATGQPKKRVSFLYGHDELRSIENSSAYLELKEFYIVDTVRLIVKNDTLNKEFVNFDALDKTDVLIVAKPMKTFSDFELLALDQYVMKGGKVIWSIDMIDDHEDSLAIPGKFFTQSEPMLQHVNLEKMLYKYGAGIKQNFISNDICAPQLRFDHRFEPWNVYYYNQAKQTSPISPIIDQWYPFACVTMEGSDLTKNIGRIKLKYPSTININTGAPATKTTLLETDYKYRVFQPYTRIRYDDAIIVQDLMSIEPPGSFYKPQDVQLIKEPLAVLLEGEFQSFFKNQLPDHLLKMLSDKNQEFKENSVSTSMLVIGDGDFLRNEIFYTVQNGKYVPKPVNVNFDPFISNEMIYGNTVFLHNVIDQMTGNDYLIPLRSRVAPARFLNKDEIFYNESKWAMINLLVPFIFVIIIGLAQWWWRRKRYAS